MYPEMCSGSGNFVKFIHSFLIRDPEKSIYSYNKAMQGDSDLATDLSEIPLFYSKIYKFYTFVKEKKGTRPVVIDPTDLQTHPEETMKSYCKAVGIQFDPNMMSWEPGHFVPRYKVWTSNPLMHSTVI